MKKTLGDFQKFWEGETRIDANLWRAVARSYIEKDQDLEEQRIFITQVSFYPKLIETLIKVLNEKANTESDCKISLDITFFSTLLPRHYWNFPLEYKDDNNIRIDAPVFLETYREIIEECVKATHCINVKIERFLVIASGDKRIVNGETILFCEKDLDTDKEYLCPESSSNKIPWQDFMNKDKEFKERFLIDIKDLSRTDDFYKNEKNKNSNIYLLKRKNIELKERKTLFDYYVENLHSKNGAKLLIICPNNSPKGTFRKGNGYCKEKDINSFSPNMSVIKICIDNKSVSYILDTYMDLKLGIVRLKIWTLDEKKDWGTLFEMLNKKSKILSVSKSFPKGKGEKRHITTTNNLEMKI